MAGRYQFDTHLTEIGLKKRLCKNSLEGPVPVVPLLFIDYHFIYHLFVDQGLNRFKSIYSKMINEKVLHIMLEKEFVSSVSLAKSINHLVHIHDLVNIRCLNM